MPLSAERKTEYFEKMKELLSTYTKCFIVNVDNVGSTQLQMTRKTLRGKGEVLMGKNTMMRKVIKEFVEENPGSPVEKLEEQCRGNVGFVFTNGDRGEIREVLESNTRPAPARVGAVAPSKVVVPKGPTGCDPGQTAFFQTLQIATKISRGQIEMVSDTDLIEEGEKVTASQAALLQKLNIEPFTYGLVLKAVYDNGSLFIANAFKAVLAVTIGMENYSFEKADMYKEYLADPSKFAGSGGGGGGGGAAAAEEAAPQVEEEEEAEIGGGMDMFGGEGGGGDY